MNQRNMCKGKMLKTSGSFIKDNVYSFKPNELAALIMLGIAEAYSESSAKLAKHSEPAANPKQTKRTYKRKDLKVEQ